MTTIDWRSVQAALTNAGYSTAIVDGVPGRLTYAALFGYVAQRQPDTVLLSIGLSASRALPAANITDSAERLAEFLAETCNETGGYTRFEENMCYSAKRLMVIWPSRFPTLASAQPFAWDPSDPDREDIALANMVYGGRMGNQINGLNDDDGWEHRGGGMLQHTGQEEYDLLHTRLGLTPDDVRDPGKSVLAACDFWTRKHVNDYCDKGDFKGARHVVNGGYIGLEEVAVRRSRALKVLV